MPTTAPLHASQLTVSSLGEAQIPSPFHIGTAYWADEERRVLVSADTRSLASAGPNPPSFEMAGPRPRLFFNPTQITCGILTCGGLCPGLNNVIRAIVLRLTYGYGVPRILGFRYGYAGLNPERGHPPLELTPDLVEPIHRFGGTILGTSRGPQPLPVMVSTLQRHNVSILFVIGGDGTLRGASALRGEIDRQGLPIAVVAVPKTIDNDLAWIERSFGFATAVDAACDVITGAHEEARGAWNGVGLVKLMGRDSGFIAAHATLSSCDVNFCLVPEVPFTLEGPGGLLEALRARLALKHHAVVVVAEGAGQELMPLDLSARDASGNRKLADIGVYLRDRIIADCAARKEEVTVKYLDPSYSIRSLPANAFDAEFCLALGQHAVHAGLAGRTGLMVGYWNHHFTHVPVEAATVQRQHLDPTGDVWQRVMEATGQAPFLHCQDNSASSPTRSPQPPR